jgi:NAD+ synthase (glutamine-hydrolysing)
LKLVKVAVAALNQTPLDWKRNRTNIANAIERARRENVGILCLPELCITGYGCEDAFLSPGTRQTALEVLAEIAPETRGIVVNLGLPLEHSRGVYNTNALVVDGRVVGFAAKRALARDGIHYEPRWFEPWRAGDRARTSALGEELPLGDFVFDVGGVRMGFEICEDAWVAERPGIELARRGVEVILNPSASHFAFGKRSIRERLVLEGSRAFGVAYLYSNLLGNEAGRAIYDGHALIAHAGAVAARARRFSFHDVELATTTVDLALGVGARAHASDERDREAEASGRVVVPHRYPAATLELPDAREEPWERSEHLKEEELVRALSLGLFDYMRKSRLSGFVVSLSGGADSSLVTCLVAMMARLALAELGPGGLAEKLAYAPELASAGDARALVGRLLTTVYQSTRNSSDTTRAAARGVAEAVGATHFELDVDPIVEAYVEKVERSLGRELSFERDDIALQNVQARVRAPSVWLIANVRSALLVSTSNRSEAAVGYATMDGDTAGGLCPIAGVDKNFVRHVLRFLEREGPVGLGAIPELSLVNAQAPTAELRPPGSGQTDEADLMPYDLLDVIERAAIRDKRSPREIFELIRTEFTRYGERELHAWLVRFFRLFARNQWKRERYAPSFHVDDESLDPKTWYRFPILSGGFERELEELARELGAPSSDG